MVVLSSKDGGLVYGEGYHATDLLDFPRPTRRWRERPRKPGFIRRIPEVLIGVTPVITPAENGSGFLKLFVKEVKVLVDTIVQPVFGKVLLILVASM